MPQINSLTALSSNHQFEVSVIFATQTTHQQQLQQQQQQLQQQALIWQQSKAATYPSK